MSSPEDPISQRISDLETRIEHQDKLLAELDDVVRVFSNRVERLERHITELQDSVSAQEIGPGDEKPPHY
jgi:uncharacterized coiled-coil protein SlyX